MMLKYLWDLETQAFELSNPDRVLQPHEWKKWNDEMARHVNLQQLNDGQEIEFPCARDLPTRFRVRKEPGASNRIPDYVLQSVAPWPAEARNGRAALPAVPPPAWPEQFLVEVQAIVENMQANKESRPGLSYLLEELGELVRDGPTGLALQLLHAFAAIQYLRCAASPDQPRHALTYYEISLEALGADSLQALRKAPPTIAHRLATLFGLLRPSCEAPRGGK